MYRAHKLEPSSSFVKFTLCYPEQECEEIRYRLETLLKNNFSHLIEYGKKYVDYCIVGKGYSSISILALHERYGLGLLKIRRLDSRRNTLEYEGMIIEYLEKTSFVPKVFYWSRDFVFMEYLSKCIPIENILREKWRSRDLLGLMHVLRRVINTLYSFDLIGVDHTELNRPYGHIYWCNSVVKVIDWESSRLSHRPRNLTSFISHILYRSDLSRGILNKMSSEDRNYVVDLLKNYKNSRNPLLVRELIKFLEQHLYQQF